MRKRFLKYCSILITILFANTASAQQDPQFTHYMYNMSVINPGYATDNVGVMNIGGLYRTQWVGAVGAPQTISAFVHSPIGKRLEAGLSIVSDEIGDVVKENNVYADIAYVIPVSRNSKMSFGVKAGATFFDTNFNGFQFTDAAPDPAFENNISKVYPNVGAGIFYFSENYYVGMSAPNLLKTKHLEKRDAIASIGVEEVHYFLTAGYVFNLNPQLKFKPAMMVRGVQGAPVAFDVTANTLINEKIEFGVGYRFDDSVSGLVAFNITPSLRIGYSYDYTLSNLGNFNSGTHEIFMLFDLNTLGLTGKGYDKSPRFF